MRLQPNVNHNLFRSQPQWEYVSDKTRLPYLRANPPSTKRKIYYWCTKGVLVDTSRKSSIIR